MRITSRDRLTALFAITAVCAWSDCLPVPATAITPFQTSSGPSFSLAKALQPTDQISITVSGSVCLQSNGFYCTNAAGVLLVPGSDGTPIGDASTNFQSAGFYHGTFSFGSLVIGNPTIGFVQLFPTNIANGLNSSNPPATLTLSNLAVSTLGGPFTSTIPAGTTLELLVVDTVSSDNSGNGFVVSQPPFGCGCAVPVPVKFSQCPVDQSNNPISWGAQTYDSSSTTICHLGGTTTTLAMALDSAGGLSYDPGSLNQFMIGHAGDYLAEKAELEKTTLDVAFSAVPQSPAGSMYFDNSLNGVNSLVSSSAIGALKGAVCSGHAVIVEVAPTRSCTPLLIPGIISGHYVLVNGTHDDSTGTHFDIVDPGCVNGLTSLDQYQNEFQIRGFVGTTGAQGAIDVSTDDTADILVTDPSGKETGYVPATGLVLQQIPSSSYALDSLSDNITGQAVPGVTHTVQILHPQPGTYMLELIGLTSGTVQLSLAGFSQDDSPQAPLLLNLPITAGNTLSFQFTYNPAHGSSIQLTPVGQITLWSNVTVSIGSVAAIPVMLSQPAPPGGTTVFLTSSDPTTVLVTPSVFIPEGRTSPNVQPQVAGAKLGAATITASAFGYNGDSKVVTVTATLSFERGVIGMFANTTQAVTLDLSSPAPPGGITINLVSDNPAVASVPSAATIPTGSASVAVPVTGLSGGTTVIHASAPNLAPASITVNVVSAGSSSLPK